MYQLEKIHREYLFDAIAADLSQVGIGVDELLALNNEEDPPGVLRHHAEPLLAFPQCLLHPLALRDVEPGPNDDRLAVQLGRRRREIDPPFLSAVPLRFGDGQKLVVAWHRLAGQPLLRTIDHQLVEGRVRHLAEIHRQDFIVAVARQF